MICRNKKGQLVLKPLIELLVAAAVFLIFIYVGKSYGSGEVFQKVGISAENALMANTFFAFPDNARTTQFGMSKFIVSFDKSSSATYAIEDDPTKAKRFFAGGTGGVFDIKLENPNSLLFQKSGNFIYVGEALKPHKERCPAVDLDFQKITVIPETKGGEIDKFTNALAGSLSNAETKNDVLENTEFVLEIISKETGQNIYFKPNLESRKLACGILNNLLDENPELDIRIIPEERESFKKSEIWVVLELSKEMENSNTIIAIAQATTS